MSKRVYLVHDLGLSLKKKKEKKRKKKEKKKKKGEHPMYSIQYPRNHTTTGVPGPGPTAKLVETMAKDLGKKRVRKATKIKSKVHIMNRSTYS